MTEVSNELDVINDLHGKALLNYHLLAPRCQNGTILVWLNVRRQHIQNFVTACKG